MDICSHVGIGDGTDFINGINSNEELYYADSLISSNNHKLTNFCWDNVEGVIPTYLENLQNST